MDNDTKTNTPYEWVIGDTAGAVWKVLHERGPMPISHLVKAVERPRDLVMQALGWLAREDKLQFEEDKRRRLVKLKES
ncbi:MAG: winged helix-turn-helix domain-containing protein [Thermoguttaceae bacterium]|nr:winged helix-turn-helix domain-containing protein [Thermoguttaceae bacterium]MDW8078229.1 winged helix-turn-helix domain-containing protein [Thermoguttaceae bacterium]